MKTRSSPTILATGSPLALLILGGGRSSRFGGMDKLLLKMGNRHIIQVIMERLSPLFHRVYMSVRNEKQRDDIISGWPALRDKTVFLVDDEKLTEENDVKAAIVGIYSSLPAIAEEYVLIISGDMPFVQKSVAEKLISHAGGEVDAVVPRWGNGYVEPTLSLYRVKKLLEAVKSCWLDSEYQLVKVIRSLENVHYVPINDIKKVDGRLLSFINVNNEKEYEDAQRLHDELMKE
ncbi:MAG: molybdenum cofactor guanylyltransferase [Promethearchaeota archaeon]